MPFPASTPLAWALAYAAIGWHVFPIERGTKRPIGRLTPHGHLDATIDEAVIRHWWTDVPDAGIGVAVATSRLVVLDVDPRNGGHFDLERIEAEHGQLLTDVLAFTGGGGQHLVFLAPPDVGQLPGKLARGIDLKADGYIVVEPSLHPSGKTYGWEGSSNPLEGAVPSPLPGWIADMARAPGAQAQDKSAAPGTLQSPPRSEQEITEVRAALAMIPALEREIWLHAGMALHKDIGGALGFELWTAWSKTCPDKFDPQDQARVWRSFTRKPMGQAVQLGTVFDLAYKHGFRRAPPRLQVVDNAQAPDTGTTNTLPELVPGPTVAALAMPVQGLNELARWIFDACPTGHVLLAQAASLSLACAAAGRRYVSEFGDPATAYFGLLVPTTSQARPVLAAAERALIRCGLRRLIRSQRLASTLHVYSAFVRSPSVLYAADDWGDQMAQAKRQPSGLLSVAHGVLAGRIHACSDVALDNWAEIGLKRPDSAPKNHLPTLYAPSLTLLAAIAEPQLRGVFKRQELGRGALDCMLFVPALAAGDWTDRLASAPAEMPAAAWHALRALQDADPASAEELLPTDVVFLQASSITVRFACELAGAERRWLEHAKSLPPNLRPLSWGARQTMRRLCVSMAAFSDPARPLVTQVILDWCERFVLECLKVTLSEMQLLSDDDDSRPDAGEKLLELLLRAGPDGMAQRDLPKRCWSYKRLSADDRQKLLGRMLADDDITDIQTARGKRYVARQFVIERQVTTVDAVDATVEKSLSAALHQSHSEVCT